ncbi:MAG TPA: cytochrome b/b6 domain-containing protein [Novosphingobium sp.]|nr:cytochrome b/b6 domain-containing protein [Novosphingobium sp.]
MAGSNPSRRVLVWDLPLRLSHWVFALGVPAMWASVEFNHMDIHKTLGVILLGFVAFRLIWGVLGSETARFASFVRGPGAILAYLRGQKGKGIGHNPLGALSVVALLGLLSAQIAAGLFAQDTDGLESGPLSHLVSYDTADLAREIHGAVFNLLLAVIVVHLCAIVFYRVIKRDNLVAPMVTGWKAVEDDTPAPARAPLWRFAVAAVLAAALAWWIGNGGPQG